MHRYLKLNNYSKLIIYKIKNSFVINLIKLQNKDKEILDRVNLYIEILVNIYNVEGDKVILAIPNSNFKLNRINLDYTVIFNNI